MLTPKRAIKTKNVHAAIGGMSLAFTTGLVSNSFVTGSEGGQLHRCFLKTRGYQAVGEHLPGSKTIKLKKDARQFLARVSPSSQAKVVRHLSKYCGSRGVKDLSARIIFKSKPPPNDVFHSATDSAFDPHVGPVYGLDCSPFNHNVFASCSADGQVRISNMLQSRPVLTIDVGNNYLFDVKWSKVRPMVFAVASADGNLYVYDLNENMGTPVVTLTGGEPSIENVSAQSPRSPKRIRVSKGQGQEQVQSVAFNPRLRNTVAFSDSHGNVKVWKLSWKLSNMRPGENRLLAKLADIQQAADEEA
jgi:WD40 repeat protein